MNETSLLPDGSLQVGERLSQGSGPPNLMCVCVCVCVCVCRRETQSQGSGPPSLVCVCVSRRERKQE